jgi:hypothetical protein
MLAPTRWVDLFIEREGETRTGGALEERRMRAFGLIFFILYGSEILAKAAQRLDGAGMAPVDWVEIGGISAGAVLLMRERWRQAGYGLVACVAIVRLGYGFPMSGNHAYLHATILGMLALFDPKEPEERAWQAGGLKWMLLVILFYSGLQKLLHGHYFRGEFFAYTISESASFRHFMRWVLPAEEIDRIMRYGWETGSGPYRLYSPMGLFLSRAAFLGEILLPAIVFVKRTRSLGIIATALFIVGIELAARELFFGMIFLNMLLLFGPARLHLRLTWVFAALSVGLILSRAGILPGFHFG